jgi:hypothetical protein
MAMIVAMVCLGSHVDRHSIGWHTGDRYYSRVDRMSAGASAERVFDAWVNPGTAAKWLFTTPKSEWHNAEMDVRVGGRWTIVDRREGTDYKAIGEYLEIDRPRRLAFTFGMPQL